MNKITKNIIWIVVILIIIVSGSAFLLTHKNADKQNQSEKLIEIKLATAPIPHLGLFHIAAQNDFFKEEGLRVETVEFTAGKFALQSLIGGSADLSFAAELPVTLASVNGEKLSILSKLNETTGGFPMILKKEGESFNPKEYFSRKRKIGTSVGGGPEFFTHEFFKKHNIPSSQYEIISIAPKELPITLANNDVDGIAIYYPFAHFAIERTGKDNVFVIKDDDLYSEIIILVARTDWVKEHEKELSSFLKALKKAQKFIKENPEKSIEIISSVTSLDKKTLTEIWDTFSLSLGMDKNIIEIMEKETIWAKNTGKILKNAIVPNFRNIIFEKPLKEIYPSSINL